MIDWAFWGMVIRGLIGGLAQTATLIGAFLFGFGIIFDIQIPTNGWTIMIYFGMLFFILDTLATIWSGRKRL